MSTNKKIDIALMYDFDKTLCTKDMQEYSFIPKVKMKPKDFWDETTKLSTTEKMDPILAYMYLMISKARANNIAIKRENFVELGKNVEFFSGVDTWFDRINLFAKKHNANIQHYIISSGLKEIIEGTTIQKHFKNIFACEFHYDINGVADWPKVAVNYTNKTQFLFRINKGIQDISEHTKLNEYVPEQHRPIPFANMIYIGDGLTDVPCMKLVKINGGISIAVYQKRQKTKVQPLLKNQRVDFISKADYSENSEMESIVQETIQKIVASNILLQRHEKQMISN